MFQELNRLEVRSALVGKGWNDPKCFTPIEPIIEVTREIQELKKVILAERIVMKESVSAARKP